MGQDGIAAGQDFKPAHLFPVRQQLAGIQLTKHLSTHRETGVENFDFRIHQLPNQGKQEGIVRTPKNQRIRAPGEQLADITLHQLTGP